MIPASDSECHFRPSKHYFRYTFALRRGRQASDPAKLIEVASHDFCSGSAAVAAGHLVSMESWILQASDERCSDRLAFSDSEFCSL